MQQELGRLLVESGKWKAHEMVMTLPKVEWLWEQMKRYRTLFNDLTRGDLENFTAIITSNDSFWIEVMNEKQECVGIVYWTGLNRIIDADVHYMFFDWRWVTPRKVTEADVHLMFFDRRPAEKVELCKEIAKWFFRENPQVNRMTATLPEIYHATIRLARRIGFKHEGKKRQSQIMGGKFVDEFVLGLLAEEIL